jgi:hypothetical protein
MFFAFIGSKIGKLITTMVALLGAVLLIFKAGQRDQKKAQKVKDLEGYQETREKIDEVEVNTDRAAALKRLRDNGDLR